MSRLQFATGAGHRRGRARQAHPMRSRHPPCCRQQRSRLSGIKGVEAGGSAPVSMEYGKSQPLRALFFLSLALSTKPTPPPRWRKWVLA